MYTIIIGIGLFVLGIICLIIGFKLFYSESLTVIGGISIIISTCILLFSGLNSIDLKKDWEKTKCQYNTLKEMVESYKEDNIKWVDNSNIYNFQLYEDVIKMNNTIDKHKVYHDSKWVGIWYSEEIGNLEHIKF